MNCNHLLVYLLSISLVTRMRALLLFVIDEMTMREFPVEVESPETATVKDLVHEVARFKGVNPTHVALSFQGTQFTDWEQPLADTGMSNECRLSLACVPIIGLRWTRADKSHQVSGSDVLRWDTAEDITQFGWLQQMKGVGILFFDQGQLTKEIVYQSGDATVTSHAFVIVPIAAEQHGVDAMPEKFEMSSWSLKQARYAKDLLVAPARGGNMGLFYKSRSHSLYDGSYRFPPGWGLLLRYKNATRPMV